VKTLVAALVFAAFASAAAAAPDVPDGKWWKRPRIAAEINLTPEQEGRIESIFTRARPGLIDRKAALEKAQASLQDALEESNADRREVAARIEAVESARAELQKARILMVLDMKQVLRPEQWERLRRLGENLRRERRERFGRFLERRREREEPR
jgi:Spy/CpxP family protein refolding chaperone